jgi:hypothetical protein
MRRFAAMMSLTFMVACTLPDPMEDDQEHAPINQAKFTQLHQEMAQIEGARSGKSIMGDTVHLNSYFNSLYQRSGYSDSLIESAFVYYHNQPLLMADIYQHVIDSLRKDAIDLNAPLE